jgi:diguanylate cyclase (GGDEF)-like protein
MSLLLACSAQALAQRFEARLFGQADGLGNLSILALTQDQNRYLWIATENGLFRYDGARFTEFGRGDGLAEPVVLNLVVDHRGMLWAGTHAGLYRFDGQRFQEVRLEGKPVHVGINSMLTATSTDEIIAQGSTGLVSVEMDGPSHAWVAMPYSRRHPHTGDLGDSNGIGVDAAGHFTLGCDNAICVHAEDSRRILGPEQGVPPDYYVAIFRARNGQMWARGRKHIVTWMPGLNGTEPERVTDVTALFPPGAITTIHRRFAEDQFGNILTPTAQGFATWDGHGWVETRATSAGPIEGATDLFVDREGSVWIGTEGSGLLESLGYRQWANFGTAEGLSSAHVYALERDAAGRVWIGGNQGTSILSPESTSPVPSPLEHEADAKDLHSFAAAPDGGMWAATELGRIYRVQASGAIDYRGEIDAYVRAMRLDAQGTLWLATGSGLFSLRCPPRGACSGTPQPYARLEKDSLHDLIIEPGGRIWTVGQHGLSSIEGDQAHRVAVEGDAGEIAQDFSSIAVAPDGTLWLGGQAPGVLHLRVTGASRARVIETYTRPRLPSDDVNFLCFDHSGQLWIGTDNGVSVIRGAGTAAQAEVRSITADDGLIWNNTGTRAFLADEDGSVWIGTSGGISHLLHPRAVLERPPFAASINRATYGRQAMPLTLRRSTPWVNGVTVIDFSGLTFRGNQSLVYHYRLLGFDATPVTTSTPFVRFQKLPPGDYRMRVIAEDPAHGVFSSPAELAFSLTPPWWRTWSFEALLAVLALLLLVRIWRWSHLALLAQRQKLERLVAERTRALEEMAVRDGLTGLLNRNAILDRLNAELHDARLKKQALCVALIDLDHFKRVNDTHGHLAGDAVLRHSAERLQAAVRAHDIVGRYGGEEFIIIFKDVDRAFGAERCERVRAALCSEPIAFENLRLTVTCSIGFACTLDEGPLTAKLIARADEAMYQAKHGGRNRVVCSAAA